MNIKPAEKFVEDYDPRTPDKHSPVTVFLDLLKSGVSNPNNIMGLMVSRGIPGRTAEHILDMALREGRVFQPSPNKVVLV